jgi:hypothetical protein
MDLSQPIFIVYQINLKIFMNQWPGTTLLFVERKGIFTCGCRQVEWHQLSKLLLLSHRPKKAPENPLI